MVRRKDTTSAREIVPRRAPSWGAARTFDDQPLPPLLAASADPSETSGVSERRRPQVDRAQVELVEITESHRPRRTVEQDLGRVRGEIALPEARIQSSALSNEASAPPPPKLGLGLQLAPAGRSQLDPPISGEPVQYHVSTITRCYEARSNPDNPVGALHHRVRSMTASAPRAGAPPRAGGAPGTERQKSAVVRLR
jgi:hypothetical protein